MRSIQVRAVMSDRMLVTRESARQLRSRLEQAAPLSSNRVELDFEGVAGISPSFFDGLLDTVEEAGPADSPEEMEIVLHNPPTEVSPKFQAIASGHGCSLSAGEGERWILRRTDPSAS